MSINHESYHPGETIAAVATPPGEGGVAIIRISGKTARQVADRVFSGPVFSYSTHTAHYGQIVDEAGNRVDDVLLLVMLGKRSYVGEETVEIHCHGGSVVTRQVLDTVLRAGARMARPGEFTFRALMNGNIDLAQAEAVQELIAAKNEWALEAAKHQLQGRLSQKIHSFQQELTELAAIFEAWVDFPEEGLAFATEEEVCRKLEEVCRQMQQLLDTYHDGKIVSEGISLCLVGTPNVGKSSLMNALLNKDRAIVTPLPGTTRDILEDHLRLNGLQFRLMDTAGIRERAALIEQEGIRRSKQAIEEADVILLVLDVSRKDWEEDKQLIEQVPKGKTIAVWNKIDLPHDGVPTLGFAHTVSVSAKQKQGLEGLHHAIDRTVWKSGPPSREEILITNVRHREALVEAIDASRHVIGGLRNNLSPELIAIDIRQSLSALGKIIGTDVTEDILSSIFSTFCIGK
ncbi:MAG: tRNA uridine-5-carboxymethylaminomethyl(34) synthesis GTPase MnmE [Waddliaceae bacterium]